LPTGFFKLVYDASTHRAWAHWLENTATAKVGKPISYAELVKRTGMAFLPNAQVIEESGKPATKAITDQTCRTGPRGGRYKIVNGKKHYGCWKSSILDDQLLLRE
jgi:hypothetical protein